MDTPAPTSLDLDLGTPTAPVTRRRRRKKSVPPPATVMAFGAVWCPVWPLVGPVLDELEEDGYKVVRVDVDQDPSAAERHRIVVLPTFVIQLDGQERRRLIGAVNGADLRQALRPRRR